MLRAHYDDLLVDITHPYSLVTDLLQKQLVDHCVGNAMLAEHLTMREKMVILVDALITAVSEQPAIFQLLMEVLENRRLHYTVAKLLHHSYGMVVEHISAIHLMRQLLSVGPKTFLIYVNRFLLLHQVKL